MLVQQIDNPQTCLLHRTSVAQSWCNVVNPNRPNRLTQWKLFRVLTQIVAPCLLHRLLQLAASTQNFHFESSRCSNQNSKSTRYTEHSAFLISAPCWGVQLQPKPNKTLKVLWRWKRCKTFNMCGWLSLTQKSSIGSCRLHWIRSQEISFDKPIVFAPKSPDTPKGNRESFFRAQTLWEHTLHWKNFNEPDIWYVHQNHFHRRGFNTSVTSAVSGLLMYNNLIPVVKGRDQGWRKGVKRMRNRSPLLSEETSRQPVEIHSVG